jgi:hypothetical protein
MATTPGSATDPDFHVAAAGTITGPVDEQRARGIAAEHMAAGKETTVWRPSWNSWRPAAQVWPASKPRWLPISVGVLLLAALVGIMIVVSRDPTSPSLGKASAPTKTATTSPPAKEPEPKTPSIAEQLAAADYPRTIAMTVPLMTDTVDDLSTGAAMLAIWAAANMRWSDIAVPENETSIGLVKKDSSTTRGKRMCIWGTIIQIAKENDAPKIFRGNLVTAGRDFVNFLAVGSTGELVERSSARICGVVTGAYAYANVAGGQTQSVQIVGMFELPENTR